MRTGLSVPGAIDGATMELLVEALLASTLKRGDLGLMENCSIQRHEELEDLLNARGAGVVFRPPYAPDLTPIELDWAKVNVRLRTLKSRTQDALLEALVDAFATITEQDIRGWFRHCGYPVASI